MKILITTDCYLPAINGVVTSVINLQNTLESMGHEVKILTLKQRLSDKDNEKVYYVKSFSAAKIYPWARIKKGSGKKQIEKIIEWRPDIIHTQCEFSTFILARKIAKRLNIPIVHTYHTVYEDYTHYFSPSENLGRRFARMLTKRILEKVQVVIVPTKKVEKILKEYGLNRKIQVLPTGLNFKNCAQQVSENVLDRLRQEYGISKEDKVCVYVGRMGKEKNIEELIQNISLVKDKNVKLLLVGDGPNKNNLESFVKDKNLQDKVIFTGMVPPKKVAQYYRLGMIFVSASTSETQGLTYVEAMANELPVLCHKDECLNELVIQGKNGFQYERPQEFCHYFEKMISSENHYNEMKKNAFHMSLKYSDIMFGEQAVEIYKKTIREYKSQNESNTNDFMKTQNAVKVRAEKIK